MGWLQRTRHWLGSTRPPMLWPEGAETCPRCRRPIPGALVPRRSLGSVPARWPLPTDSELLRLCPIHGHLASARHPHPRSVEELRQAATDLTGLLAHVHDKEWADLFRAAAQADPESFVRKFGDALAVLIRHGPMQDLAPCPIDIEQLLIDTVALWPAVT